MLCLGFCGLHVINGALQTGHKASKWNVQALLKSIYKLFKDSPARCADYTVLTESDIFLRSFVLLDGQKMWKYVNGHCKFFKIYNYTYQNPRNYQLHTPLK